MPLKRTPPTTPQVTGRSDSNLSSAAITDTDNETSSNVTTRPRARKRQHDDDISAFMVELKKSFETLKMQQNTMQGTINEIQQQNADIIKSMDFLSQQYEDMKHRFTKMETERRTQLAYIQTLEAKVENLERSQKLASIEIRNIPVQKSETKDDLLTLVQKVGEATKTSIEESHIRDVFRLNADKGGNRTIVVDFSSVLLKERILKFVKTHNRTNKDNKLNTDHLHLGGQRKPIFIAECLTQKGRRLFHMAREFSKNNNYEFCWTAHGRVFLRKNVGASSHRIVDENDLAKLQPDSKL